MTPKKLLPRFLLGASSLVVAVLLAEVGVRLHLHLQARGAVLDQALERSRAAELGKTVNTNSLLGLVQASRWPDVVFELKPGLRGKFLGEPVRINSHGFRGPEVTVEKPRNTFRIVGLGDSVMFGWGVSQGKEYMRRLERRLESATPARVEVLNFAVPAYNTAIEVATFERKAMAYDPDLVILHMMFNDGRLPRFMSSNPPLLSPRYSALWSLTRSAGGRVGLVLTTKPEASAMERAAARRFAYMMGSDGIRKALERLARLCRKRQIPVLIVVLPDGARPMPLAFEAQEQYGFRVFDPRPFFFEYLEGEGLAMADYPRVFWLSEEDGHPNALGHRLYAQFLARSIRQAGLLPSQPEGA